MDTGIGIEADEQEVIFDEFYQVGNLSRDRTLGLGLGLALARRLAALIGSEITVKSRLGHGSRFSVSLERASASQAVFGGMAEDGAPFEGPPPALALVVEDNELVRLSTQMMLEDWGYRVETAASGVEAVRMVEQGLRPRIILADSRLGGGMDGAATAARIRQICGRDLPTLLVTGEAPPAPGPSGMSVLYKPVVAEALKAEVARLARLPTKRSITGANDSITLP